MVQIKLVVKFKATLNVEGQSVTLYMWIQHKVGLILWIQHLMLEE